MKEAFLGKKTVSNQRSLAQSDQELALVTTQFIHSVMKMQGTDKVHWFEIQLQAIAVVILLY
jgi:hypothetical protein